VLTSPPSRARTVGARAARNIALVAAAALVAGCHQGLHPDPGPDAVGSSNASPAGAGATGQLSFPHGKIPPFGFGKRNTPTHQTVAMNSATMCVAGGGPAQIVAVTLNNPENLALVDWGTRPYPPSVPDMGYWNGKVLDDPTFTQATVKAQCARHDLVELDLSAQRTSTAVGIAHGFTVTTTTGKLFVPMRIALCAATCPDEALEDLP